MKNNNLTDYASISLRLKEVIQEKSLKRGELAKLSGYSSATVSAWLKGENLSPKAIAAICQALDISANWLLLGIGNKTAPFALDLSQLEKTLIHTMRNISPDFHEHILAITDMLACHKQNIESSIVEKCAYTLIHDSDLAVAMTDLEGNIMLANECHDRLLGISRSDREALGLKSFDFVSPAFHARLREQIRNIHNPDYANFCYFELLHFRTKNTIPVITKASMVDYENNPAIAVLIKPLPTENV